MTSDIMSRRFGIGASVLRKEDKRFITGRGRYTDDIDRPDQVHAHFVRSPHAHAKIKAITVDAAGAMAGVVAVFTGEDLAADNIGSLPCGWIVTDKHGEPHRSPPHFALARDKVRYVGDHVAVVIADTAAQAKDAAQAVEVDYDVLPANVDTARALSAPQLHDEAPGNLCYDWEMGDEAAVDEAFAKADHVTAIEFVNNRLVPNAMEPRAAVAEYDPGLDEYTLWLTNQNPHLLRLNLCTYVFGIPESKLRVVAPDVGGGFGSKIYTYAEDTVCIWAARKVGRPVKWAAERSESFQADAHARDHVTTAKLALDTDGRFLAMKVDTIANMGAYLSNHATCIPSYLYATLLAGQYTTPLIHCRVQAVFNNTAMVDAYRGAGRPEAAFVVERLVEVAAREMGIDPVELRKRNFVPPDAFPYQTPVALEYDSGQYALAMDDALALVDYAGFESRPGRVGEPGQAEGHRFCVLHRSLRHRALRGRRGVGLEGGVLGGGAGALQRDQHRLGLLGHAQPWPGSRDHLRPGCLGHLRTADRERRDRAGRHPPGPDGNGHLRIALHRRRRRRHPQGLRQDHREGPKDRGSSDGGVSRRHRVRQRYLPGRRHGQDEVDHRSRARRLHSAQLSGRPGAGPGRDGVLRSPPTSPIPRARTSPRSRSIPIPARRTSCSGWRSMTSAR